MIVPIFLPLFSCHQENSHWEQAQVADFYTVVYTWVRIPSMGCPKDNAQLTGFRGLITPVGSGRVLPPSVALSESAQVSVWIDMAVSLSLVQSFLSLLRLPLPLSSHLHSKHFYPEKFLSVSKFCDWYLCVVVLSVQLLLQVSTDIMGTVEHLSLGIQT